MEKRQWDGDERRKFDRTDHDVLTRIDVNLSNFMKRFDEHVLEDNGHFDRLYKKTSATNKYIWMAMGGMTVIIFILERVWK